MSGVLIPDLGLDRDGLIWTLVELEELLITFAVWEEEGEVAPGELPVPLAGSVALNALRRIWTAVAPTQGDRAVEAGLTGRLLSPDGRYEHAPLRLVGVDPADVAALAAAARELGDPHAGAEVAEALADGQSDMGADELVTRAAQLAGLLSLEETADTALLRQRAAVAGHGDDVVMTEVEEAAYQRTAGRFDRMWSAFDDTGLSRFLY